MDESVGHAFPEFLGQRAEQLLDQVEGQRSDEDGHGLDTEPESVLGSRVRAQHCVGVGVVPRRRRGEERELGG